MTDINLVAPETNLLGLKKRQAEYSVLKNWLIEKTRDADYLILSLDMLLYGGIVPSRLHHFDYDKVKNVLLS